MKLPRIVVVVSGGVVQNVMTDAPDLKVDVHLLDYDNLEAGQMEPTVELDLEVNPEEVELVISGKHEDVKEHLDRNRLTEKEFAFEG